MNDSYLWLKWLHIVSSTVLFGTGLGTAFHLYATHLRGDVAAIASAARNTVLADWLFIATSGVIQIVSGLLLVRMAGYDRFESWLVTAYSLFALAGLCWLQAVRLQYRVRDLATEALEKRQPLPSAYYRAMRLWFILGWPAFLGLLVVFALMVTKPVLW